MQNTHSSNRDLCRASIRIDERVTPVIVRHIFDGKCEPSSCILEVGRKLRTHAYIALMDAHANILYHNAILCQPFPNCHRSTIDPSPSVIVLSSTKIAINTTHRTFNCTILHKCTRGDLHRAALRAQKFHSYITMSVFVCVYVCGVCVCIYAPGASALKRAPTHSTHFRDA